MGRRTNTLRKLGDRNRGQALILVALVLPLLVSMAALVVDGANLMAHRRLIQNAADAAALAVAQNIDISTGNCNSACLGYADDYARKNGWSGPTLQQCGGAVTTNCYTWPYKGSAQLVAVRLTMTVPGLFTSAVGLGKTFSVSARAAAAANGEFQTTTIPGTTSAGFTDPNQTIPGQTHTSTDPDTVLGGDGVGFAMSRTCGAISYTGAGAKTGDPSLGAFATNGGLSFQGNAPKKVRSLFYDVSGCPAAPPSPPSGTSSCTSTSWGDSTESNNLCVKTLVDLGQNHTLPINWPITPPALPTLKAGSTWTPATDYPSKCLDPGTTTISGGWGSSHPPGIYCVTGSATTLQLGGGGLDLTGGDGYTFFALGGAKISVAGNTTKLQYYWPSACGPRPTSRGSFTCFGRTIAGYDPQTLLDATSQASSTANCAQAALCLNGQNGSLVGDVFAPLPAAFPPTPGPTDIGASVFIAGGALSAGSGFFESWLLTIQGNTGSYQGTGVPIVIPGATHTTTDASTVITGQTHTGTTVGGTTQTSITATTVGLDE